MAAPDSGPLVSLYGVSRSFTTPAGTLEVLRGCDLAIWSGESVALVGPSGSGKSTLLNILGLLDTPTLGSYLLDGRDTTSLSRRERESTRATKLGFVFQDFRLLEHQTAAENVELGLAYAGVPWSSRARLARHALEQVGLVHRTEAFPSTLSGGEKQRVSIARAISREPAVLLCDEPTGNLDESRSREVIDLLNSFAASGTAVLIVTHDRAAAQRCDRLHQLAGGSLK